MSDPFAAPSAVDPIEVGELSIWIRLAQGTLAFVGLAYGLMTLTLVPLMMAMPFVDPELAHDPEPVKWMISSFMGVFGCVCVGGYATLPVLAVVGLQRRALWGWVIGLIIGAMLTPSGCMPFGALILVGLLHPEGRDIYLK